MGTEVYALSFCTVEGGLLSQAGSIAFQRQTGSQAVLTLALGYAGESPGAAMVTGNVSCHVPSADFEFNADVFMESLQAVEIGFLVGQSRTLVLKGFIIEDSLKQSVNSPIEYDFQFRGSFARFQ